MKDIARSRQVVLVAKYMGDDQECTECVFAKSTWRCSLPLDNPFRVCDVQDRNIIWVIEESK